MYMTADEFHSSVDEDRTPERQKTMHLKPNETEYTIYQRSNARPACEIAKKSNEPFTFNVIGSASKGNDMTSLESNVTDRDNKKNHVPKKEQLKKPYEPGAARFKSPFSHRKFKGFLTRKRQSMPLQFFKPPSSCPTKDFHLYRNGKTEGPKQSAGLYPKYGQTFQMLTRQSTRSGPNRMIGKQSAGFRSNTTKQIDKHGYSETPPCADSFSPTNTEEHMMEVKTKVISIPLSTEERTVHTQNNMRSPSGTASSSMISPGTILQRSNSYVEHFSKLKTPVNDFFPFEKVSVYPPLPSKMKSPTKGTPSERKERSELVSCSSDGDPNTVSCAESISPAHAEKHRSEVDSKVLSTTQPTQNYDLPNQNSQGSPSGSAASSLIGQRTTLQRSSSDFSNQKSSTSESNSDAIHFSSSKFIEPVNDCLPFENVSVYYSSQSQVSPPAKIIASESKEQSELVSYSNYGDPNIVSCADSISPTHAEEYGIEVDTKELSTKQSVKKYDLPHQNKPESPSDSAASSYNGQSSTVQRSSSDFPEKTFSSSKSCNYATHVPNSTLKEPVTECFPFENMSSPGQVGSLAKSIAIASERKEQSELVSCSGYAYQGTPLFADSTTTTHAEEPRTECDANSVSSPLSIDKYIPSHQNYSWSPPGSTVSDHGREFHNTLSDSSANKYSTSNSSDSAQFSRSNLKKTVNDFFPFEKVSVYPPSPSQVNAKAKSDRMEQSELASRSRYAYTNASLCADGFSTTHTDEFGTDVNKQLFSTPPPTEKYIPPHETNLMSPTGSAVPSLISRSSTLQMTPSASSGNTYSNSRSNSCAERISKLKKPEYDFFPFKDDYACQPSASQIKSPAKGIASERKEQSQLVNFSNYGQPNYSQALSKHNTQQRMSFLGTTPTEEGRMSTMSGGNPRKKKQLQPFSKKK